MSKEFEEFWINGPVKGTQGIFSRKEIAELAFGAGRIGFNKLAIENSNLKLRILELEKGVTK